LIRRYRNRYAKLLRLYPKAYRERFGEAMEQTFDDLCRDRVKAGKGLFGFALWTFFETFAGIFRETVTVIIMQTLTKRTAYRTAIGLAVTASLLLVWMSLAVGTEDDNSGGLMYLGVFVFGSGAIIAHFRPQGMVRTLFAAALAQALVAVIAMIAWGQYLDFLIVNGFFIALWVGSALLLRRAIHEHNQELRASANS
jgi:hypothetical protein